MSQTEPSESIEEPLISETQYVGINSQLDQPNDRRVTKLSPNVPIGLGFTGLSFTSGSLWGQNVLAVFIYQISGHDSRNIGYVTLCMGLLQLISSFPGGYFADKYRRDIVIRSSAFIGIIAISMVTTSVALKNLWLVGGAFAIVGIYWGLITTSITALYADSLRDEERPKYITWRYTTMKLGNMVAPVVAIIMFARTRNLWSADDCADVIYCSQAIGFLSVILQCFMSDDKIVSRDMASHEICDEEDHENGSLGSLESNCESAYVSITESERSVALIESDDEKYDYIIPLCICGADILQAFANGMSDYYFPVFFFETLKMKPIFVQIVYLCSNMCQLCGSIVGYNVGKAFGRCPASIFLRIMGSVALALMITSGHFKLSPVFVCIFYVLKMALVNSTVPLTGSLLMDSVPKNHRGKWAGLDSMMRAFSSVSALIGGFLIHEFGIYSVFYGTTVLLVIATIPLAILSRRYGV